MSPWITIGTAWYDRLKEGVSPLRHALLLVLRLYFGWQLAMTGWNKLTNLGTTADYFASLGIFWPTANALVSGLAECVGGVFLLMGLASRLVAVVLIINFTVAYAMAHTEQALALFSHPNDFLTAPPFLYLLTSVLVLIFGPGLISVDTLLRKYFIGPQPADFRERGAIVPEALAFPVVESDITRREVVALSVAAVGGLIAGAKLATIGGLGRGEDRQIDQETGQKQGKQEDGGQPQQTSDKKSASDGKNLAAIKRMDNEAPEGVQPSLLLEEPHVCCGLNTCEGKAKGGENDCAGQGRCATVESHVCQGMNACKGRGGCGEYPGQNTCDGKGACAVPLKEEQWEIARPKFEKLMALAGRKKVGPAPPNCPK